MPLKRVWLFGESLKVASRPLRLAPSAPLAIALRHQGKSFDQKVILRLELRASQLNRQVISQVVNTKVLSRRRRLQCQKLVVKLHLNQRQRC